MDSDPESSMNVSESPEKEVESEDPLGSSPEKSPEKSCTESPEKELETPERPRRQKTLKDPDNSIVTLDSGDSDEENESGNESPSKGYKGKKVACPCCDKMIDTKSMARHLDVMHGGTNSN